MKTPASFKVMDIKRAVHAVQSAGVEIARVEIEPGSGKITVVAGKATERAPDKPDQPATGWEDVHNEATKNAVRA